MSGSTSVVVISKVNLRACLLVGADEDGFENMRNDTDDTVGYKRPPVHARFQPGISGNPKGRPKSSPNFHQVLVDELGEPARDGDSTTKLQAIIRALVADAANGNLRAVSVLFGLCGRMFADTPQQSMDDDVNAEDRAIAEEADQRLRKRAAAQEENGDR